MAGEGIGTPLDHQLVGQPLGLHELETEKQMANDALVAREHVVPLGPAAHCRPAPIGYGLLDAPVQVRVVFLHGLVEGHLALLEGQVGVHLHEVQHPLEGIRSHPLDNLVQPPPVD